MLVSRINDRPQNSLPHNNYAPEVIILAWKDLNICQVKAKVGSDNYNLGKIKDKTGNDEHVAVNHDNGRLQQQ